MEIGLVQQGDVLFHRVDGLPEAAVRKNPENGVAIFAYGEATGHHHSSAVRTADGVPNFRLYEADATLFVEVVRDVAVVHQEHGPVTLTPGIYRRGLVREVDPFEDEIRFVRD